jgi:hypothetical protein
VYASKYGASARCTTECKISNGDTELPAPPEAVLEDATPGRFITCIWDEMGMAGSIGCGRLIIATEAVVEGEKEISDAIVYA